MDQLLFWVGMAAVAVNAISGVLEAEEKEMDLMGAIMAALAAALGGGSIRDVLIDRPVFWVVDQTYLIVALLTAIITFFWGRKRKISPNFILYPDAAGLALFTIVGTQIALQWHTPWLAASLMGVITGVLGGVLRDILCNDVPTVFLKGELYASAAWLGALALIILQEAGFHAVDASWMAMAIVLGLRLCAIHFHLTLPAFRPRRDD